MSAEIDFEQEPADWLMDKFERTWLAIQDGNDPTSIITAVYVREMIQFIDDGLPEPEQDDIAWIRVFDESGSSDACRWPIPFDQHFVTLHIAELDGMLVPGKLLF